MRVIESVVEEDITRSRDQITKVKDQKLSKLRPPRHEEHSSNSTTASVKHKPSPVEVINQSSTQLTATEMSVLSKGLTFVPSRRQTVAQLTADLKEWERLMRLREYWYDAKQVDVGG